MLGQITLDGMPEQTLLRPPDGKPPDGNHMVRTPDGWRIERLIQHVGWEQGNTGAVGEAAERNKH